MDFLTPAIGETAARFVIIALVVLLLGALTLLVIGMTMRVFGGRRSRKREARNPGQRLAVPDVLPVDARRKLVLIRRDNIEHLLLVGGNTDIVIEPTIQRHIAAGRMPAAAARESAAPQPATMPPQAGVVGTGRPLAARSQRAVQAAHRPPAETQAGAAARGASDAPAPAPMPTGEEAAALAAARPSMDKAHPAQPKPALIPTPRPEPSIAGGAAPRPQGTASAAAPLPPNPARTAPVAATAAQPARADRPAARPATPAEAADIAAARPLPPRQDGRNQEPRPASSSRRPVARPTAAAAPPAGRTAPPPAAPQAAPPAGSGPSEPLPRPASQPRTETRRQPAAKLVEGDTDMTALLGEIFGQNKH
jgi:flagellar protein FliO/FliZ